MARETEGQGAGSAQEKKRLGMVRTGNESKPLAAYTDPVIGASKYIFTCSSAYVDSCGERYVRRPSEVTSSHSPPPRLFTPFTVPTITVSVLCAQETYPGKLERKNGANYERRSVATRSWRLLAGPLVPFFQDTTYFPYNTQV